MYKILVTIIMTILFSILIKGQKIIFSDNFEGFSPAQQVVCQNPTDWVLWSKAPCDTIEDPYISSNYAYSGINSVVLALNNDLVKTFGPYTSGKWEISWQMYIPLGKSGYFNTLHHFSDSCYYCSKWAMQVFFNSNGTGTVDAAAQNAASFSYTQDKWVPVIILVDLDIDHAELWLDENMIIQWQWSLGWNGNGGLLQLNATDFYGFASTDEMYVDNYVIKDLLHFSTLFSINDGWNLVSFPGIHPNSMLADTLYRYRDFSSSVFGYDGSGYASEDTLKCGAGYWLNHSGNRIYNWNGTVQGGELYPQLIFAEADSLDGSTGWNLVGCYDYEFLTDSLKTDPPGLISGYPYRYLTNGGYSLATIMWPGNAYWIYLTGNGKIIYPERPILLKQPKDKVINDSWTKITFVDAAGKQMTVYSSIEEKSVDKYLLPPKPPAGIFDVRYTTDKMIEDISIEKMIEISGAMYPIKIKVDGMNVKLQDAINGKMLNTTILDNKEIVIENSDFNKLIISSVGTAPDMYSLEQNYPNPFNPSTTIRYSIPEANVVVLKVYNMIGQEVTTLVNEKQEAGIYEINFNSTGLSSGVYLYKIQAGNFVLTMKMILMK